MSVGHWESHPKRKVDNITGLSQKTRQSSNKQSNFTLKGTSKMMKTNSKVSRREDIIKMVKAVVGSGFLYMAFIEV